MLKEFVGKIAELTEQSLEVKTMPLHGSSRVALLYRPGGPLADAIPYRTDLPPIKMHAGDIESFCRLVVSVAVPPMLTGIDADGSTPYDSKPAGRRSVFHTAGQVIGVIGEATREHWVKFPLKYDQRWTAINGWKTEMTQAEARRFLLFTLGRSALPEGELLVRAIEDLKFTRNEQSTGKIQTTEAAYGKQIVSAVTGVEKLPASFIVRVTIYENYPYDVDVPVLLDCDTDAAKLLFRVAPGALVEAMRQTHESIEANLNNLLAQAGQDIGSQLAKGEEVPVFYGDPGID